MNGSRVLLPYTKFAPARERLTSLRVLLPHIHEGVNCSHLALESPQWSVYVLNHYGWFA